MGIGWRIAIWNMECGISGFAIRQTGATRRVADVPCNQIRVVLGSRLEDVGLRKRLWPQPLVYRHRSASCDPIRRSFTLGHGERVKWGLATGWWLLTLSFLAIFVTGMQSDADGTCVLLSNEWLDLT